MGLFSIQNKTENFKSHVLHRVLVMVEVMERTIVTLDINVNVTRLLDLHTLLEEPINFSKVIFLDTEKQS